MKMIDIVDENNVMLGEEADSKSVLVDELWHREVAIIIMNNNERILLIKNSDFWTVKTTFVESGEGPIFTAIRLVNKEFKLKVSNSDLKLLKVTKDPDNYSFKYYYLLKGDFKLADFEDENTKVRFMSFDDIMEKLESEDQVFENFLKRDFEEIINSYKKRVIENYD